MLQCSQISAMTLLNSETEMKWNYENTILPVLSYNHPLTIHGNCDLRNKCTWKIMTKWSSTSVISTFWDILYPFHILQKSNHRLCISKVKFKYQEQQKPHNIRWSPRLKQREKNLDNTDNCRFILLLVKNIGQQLLHCLQPEGDRHKDRLGCNSQMYACTLFKINYMKAEMVSKYRLND